MKLNTLDEMAARIRDLEQQNTRLRKTLRDVTMEIKQDNETISAQHNLMKSAENRGIEKGLEESHAYVIKLEGILSRIVRADSAGTDSYGAINEARAVLSKTTKPTTP